MALRQATGRQEAAPPNTVSLDRLFGIRGARRIKTTPRRKHRRDPFLICSNDTEKKSPEHVLSPPLRALAPEATHPRRTASDRAQREVVQTRRPAPQPGRTR